MYRRSFIGSGLLFPLAARAAFAAPPAAADYGLSVLSKLKYGPDFTHFDYANPNALKGGSMKLSAVGTYDTLNPFIVKGVPAAGIGEIFETLMAQSEDEAESEYGLVAESAEIAPDRLSVLYTLRKEARFHDGSPITPSDIVWTFNTLRTSGQPLYRSYYADVAEAVIEGARGVRFKFKTANNRELAWIIGQMIPALSQKYYASHDFTKTTLTPPLGSGPYVVAAVQPGQSITYKRVADYWAGDLPVNKGRFNVDTIRYDYYRDPTVALEAFKAGDYEIRQENSAKAWATGYDSPALRHGLIKKIVIPNQLPTPMQGFGYNLRRPIFHDPRVRDALAYAFDFQWSNKNLFYGLYRRTRSYFDNSELAATGLPQGEELKILEPFRGKIPDEVFTKEYNPPTYTQSFTLRDGLVKAIGLLKEAGWSFKNGALANDNTGQPFVFEILLFDPQMERIVLPFTDNLKRIGITATVRLVDTAQYQQRMNTFDFDMTIALFAQSLSPGNEQRDFFGSRAADRPGSQNVLGIKNPVIDQLIEELIRAPTRAGLVAHVHAFDRVLQWSYYLIPQFHLNAFWVAYWDKFRRPAISPKYGFDLDTWWVDQTAASSLAAKEKTGAAK
jgi:microcin C transport system substrate-binding protein